MEEHLQNDPERSDNRGKAMLDSAFEYVMVPLAILDRKFNFVRVNKTFVRMSGRSEQVFPGRNYFEFFPSPEDVDLFMKVLNTKEPYIARGKPMSRITPEGHTSFWDWSLNPVVDEDGTVNHLVLSWNDVTEREQAKLERDAAYNALELRVEQRTRELRETDEMLDLAIKSADLGIWIWDLVTGKTIWSKRRRELFGLDPDNEINFDDFINRLIPEDRDKVRHSIEAALKDRTGYNLEVAVDLPDGQRRWLRTRGKGFSNDKGDPVRLVGMAWDITEARTIRERLKENEERLRIANITANEAVWDWDCRINHVAFNEVFKERYGRPENEGSSSWWRDRLHPEDRERTWENFKRALKGTSDRWEAEYRFQKPDGSYAYVHDRAYLAREESGRVRRVVGAMLDLTERKRMEEELERRTNQLITTNTELESYSYIVSHDLQSPVRAMEGYTRMILKDYGDQFDQELKRRFDIILETTALMKEMIEAMLSLSKACNAELNISDCDMKGIFQESWETLKKEIPGRRIRFVLEEMPKVQADCTLMKQAIYNLLSNAVKFTGNREEAVIKAGSREDGGYTFYVEDNGAGFDMNYYDRLFTIFKRLHSPKEFKETGIGLPIVQRIIVRHGGEIWAKGEVDKGATFYFSLPKKAFRLE